MLDFFCRFGLLYITSIAFPMRFFFILKKTKRGRLENCDVFRFSRFKFHNEVFKFGTNLSSHFHYWILISLRVCFVGEKMY